MKYFVTNKNRKGTAYLEFYKGHWDGKTFNKDDSLFLNENILSDNNEFNSAILSVVPEYDPYGITEISATQWKEIGDVFTNKSIESRKIYMELNSWLLNVFQTADCFTIIGL